MVNNIDRRSLVKGAAWGAPVVVATSAIPAYAASPVYQIDQGLYVTTQNTLGANSKGAAFDNTTNITTSGPTTVPASFVGSTNYSVNGSPLNKNFDQATNSATVCTNDRYKGLPISINAEGKFPPTGTGDSLGSYRTTTGYWFSSPTKSPDTGTGYSGTTVLKAGATFVTEITYSMTNLTATQYSRIKNSPDSFLAADLAGVPACWTPTAPNPSTNSAVNKVVPVASQVSTISTEAVAGTLSYSQPTYTFTQDSVGNTATFKGTVTFTTSADYTVPEGKFAMVRILPVISFPTWFNYPNKTTWTLTGTSYIANANLVLNPADAPSKSITVTGQQTTSTMNACNSY